MLDLDITEKAVVQDVSNGSNNTKQTFVRLSKTSFDKTKFNHIGSKNDLGTPCSMVLVYDDISTTGLYKVLLYKGNEDYNVYRIIDRRKI